MGRVEVSDNFDEAMRDWLPMAEQETHTLTLINSAEYAEALHALEAYYVFNDEHAEDEIMEALRGLINRGEEPTSDNIVRALEVAGGKELNFLRDYLTETKPGARRGDGPRLVHPGGWADVSAMLLKAFRFKVDDGPRQGAVQ